MRQFIFIGSWAMFSWSCFDRPHFEVLDMRQYGLPLEILVPDTARVVRKEYEIMNDITVRSGDGFNIQIFQSNVTSSDAGPVKREQLESIWQDPNFIELVLDEEQGFIFKKYSVENGEDFDFRYVKIIENKEYLFQAGLVWSFSQKEVELMYRSVK
ncbi:MAG: hypothetical protein ABIQ11_07005 [Saprospiraceae bacterium]